MGQKVNPNGFRYGITKKHQTTWYAEKKDFATYLLEDEKIRTYLYQFTREYLIGKIEIARNAKNNVLVTIHAARLGAILGQGGANLKKLNQHAQKATRNHQLKMTINVVPIDRAELNAKLVAENIATQLENRVSFRRAQKMAIRSTLRSGAKGIKTQVSGRLNGADMARSEGYTEGIMALHTLRQNVDYATATARTTYGAIGVKVWISLGLILDGGKK